jgi:dsDNA-specific endonuclease/ATPase MutS2
MKTDHIMVSHLRASGILKQVDRDSASALFVLEDTEESSKIKTKIEKADRDIADEEEMVREKLSREIWEHHELIYSNCAKIGRLDLALAKAVFARAHGCVRPEIADEYMISVKAARNLMVDSVLKKQGGSFVPVSVELRQGVTCITGPNMAGKTVAVKLAAQCALLAQYGFFIPCERARIGLSGCVEMLTGDNQSLADGLSSFGGEMAELAGVFSRRIPRTLLMVAELANGTNPEEGSAITRGVIEFMKDRHAITVITTHYDVVKKGDSENGIHHIVMTGADRSTAPLEEGGDHVPREALRTAEELGVSSEIIDAAKEWMKREH